MRLAGALLIAGVLIAGCTSREAYQSSQGLRRAQCDRILDADARARCFATADQDWDAYRREREAAKR